MTTYTPSQCRACTRLRQPADGLTHCEAFPGGIPFEIIGLGGDHRQPVDGDHGLRFDQSDTDAARWMLDEWQRVHDTAADTDTDAEAESTPLARSFAAGLADTILSRGVDTHPGGEQLKHYWTKGKGLAKWINHPHPWTALRNHLVKYVGPERANRIASEWFHEATGLWPGERKGSNPVGPG